MLQLISRFFASLILANVFGMASAQDATESSNQTRLQVGDKAPPLAIEHWISDVNATQGPVAEFRNGHIYVVEFWGTWCVPCIGKMPELAALQQEFLNQNVTIIGVMDEKLKDVNVFLEKKCHHDESITYRQLTSAYCLAADPDGSVFNDYMKGIDRQSFPKLAIVGKTGLIEFFGTVEGLRNSLKAIIADQWDREAIRRQQHANWAAGKTMLEVNELCKAGEIDEVNHVFEQRIAQADQELRVVCYQMQIASARRKSMTPEQLASLEKRIIEATVESQRWQRNRFRIMMRFDPSRAITPFQQLTANYASSLNEQINFAWEVYLASTTNDSLDKQLIDSAKMLAKSVSEKSPEDAIFLDVYAHLLFASGATDESLETFKLAIQKSNDENRSEIESDYKAILNATKK